MQERLESLGEMAAGIAHEIRNPLTSIKGASNLLSDEVKRLDLPRVREYHDIIREEIDRLNHILLNFQYFTRPLKIEKELIPVNEIIRKTVRLAETAPANITIKQDLSGNSPKIMADASLLRQVFLNLIKNAEEACGPEGELVIKTESLPPWFRISFSDNGPGISAENLNRIFEPFFTTKSSRDGDGAGDLPENYARPWRRTGSKKYDCLKARNLIYCYPWDRRPSCFFRGSRPDRLYLKYSLLLIDTMDQIIFTIDTSLAFTAALVNLIFAILVSFRTSRSSLYLAFSLAAFHSWSGISATSCFSYRESDSGSISP